MEVIHMEDWTLTLEERFEIALSLELGIPLSKLKDVLSQREYIAYQKYFYTMGFGSEASFLRSGNQIITIIQQISGAMGGKPAKLKIEEIYPQLTLPKDKEGKVRPQGNYAVDWDSSSERERQQLTLAGIYDEDGIPIKMKKTT
jgi:hypothetical protein